MEYLDPLAYPFWQTVGLAVACGGLVGVERQLRGKAAGVRTSILICLGTALFVRLGASVTDGDADPTRVIGQVVTGVGFLGAGVILAREGVVHGVTTAAVIWVLAAIGAMIGIGHFVAALAVAAVAVAILTGVEFLESQVASLARGVHARGGSGGAR
jgi:putative Mg2+ transporter-C (MgtC) family protein